MSPSLIRGDIGFGNNGTMVGCEERNLNFLFKLRQSKKIKQLLLSLKTSENDWIDAGDGWSGIESEIKLSGWGNKRRVVVLRRQHGKKDKKIELPENTVQLELPLVFVDDGDYPEYEYQVLVTNTSYDIITLAQLYRDRGDCENNFDGLKNQWGWGGFNARNLKRTQAMASLVALVYNWWNIFCRLAEPDRHMEAKTSHPQFQNIIGRMTKPGESRIIYLSAMGAESEKTLLKFNKISEFISGLCSASTQLTKECKWVLILREAFKKFHQSEEIKMASSGRQMLLAL